MELRGLEDLLGFRKVSYVERWTADTQRVAVGTSSDL
jgi:hypothetical protein